MIDWLRRDPADPAIDLCGRTLPIAVRRHATAQRMILRLSPCGGEVRVTLPKWGRTYDAIAFARSRAQWLERQLVGLPQRSGPRPGGSIPYRGNELPIDWRKEASRKPVHSGGALTLGGPQESLAPRLQRWLESEALHLMQVDLTEYCARAGAERPEMRLSRAQRRWGSCSSSGILRLNWRLVQAPDFVRRSVVAHEAAHLVHFDHSPAFHALLRTIYEGEIASADAWLKTHGRALYASFG